MTESSTPRTEKIAELVSTIRSLARHDPENIMLLREDALLLVDAISEGSSRADRAEETAVLRASMMESQAGVNADLIDRCLKVEAYAVTLQSLLRCISFTNDGILVKPQPGREDYGVFLHVTPGGTKATILQEFKALIDAALAGQPAKGNSKFSDFIRNAEGEERAAVFERVIDKSIERQREYEIGRIEDDFGPLASQEKGRAEWPPSSHAVGTGNDEPRASKPYTPEFEAWWDARCLDFNGGVRFKWAAWIAWQAASAQPVLSEGRDQSDSRLDHIQNQHVKALQVGNGLPVPPPTWQQIGILLAALGRGGDHG